METNKENLQSDWPTVSALDNLLPAEFAEFAECDVDACGSLRTSTLLAVGWKSVAVDFAVIAPRCA